MASVRLRGLTTENEFDEIVKYIRSSTRRDSVRSYGVSAGGGIRHEIEATITFRDTSTKNSALQVLEKYIALSWPQARADDTFSGITILSSPASPDNDFPVE